MALYTQHLIGLVIFNALISARNGKVLKIGGVKEKTMAAVREGLTTLIFPAGNRPDVERLPDYIKGDITFHFVENYE